MYGWLAGKSWALKRNSAAGVGGPFRKLSGEPRGRIECLRREKYPQRVFGACWNFHDIAEAASRLESLVEVIAAAASGRCWLELYRDPSCLIGEAPESRKEVSRLAYSLSSTV